MADILQTLITAPRNTEQVIHRKRLLDLLEENKNKPLILLCAAAGYGKTTLVRDFISHHQKSCSWLYVNSDIDNYYEFLKYLSASLNKLNASFGENTFLLINSLNESREIPRGYQRIKDIINIFFNEFVSVFKDDIYLIIDDLHNLMNVKNDEWVKYLFDTLFDSLPENLHIIVTSRQTPGFNLAKLKAKRRLLMIDNNELSFDRDELKDFFDKIYSIDVSDEDMKIVDKKTKGWITGVHLITQSYKNDLSKLKDVKNILNEDLFNYFAEDIFENLDDKTKSFLISTSYLSGFDEGVCNLILGTSNSEELIRTLVDKNIFIQSTFEMKGSNRIQHYSYHDLFRDFLAKKSGESSVSKKAETNSEIIIDYYIQENDFKSAVTFSVKSKKYEKAVELIKKHFEVLFEKGEYGNLWSWLSGLPEEIISDDEYMLYYFSMLQLFYKSKIEESLCSVNKSIELSVKKKNVSLSALAYLLKAEALYLMGDIEQMTKDLEYILKLKTEDEIKAKIYTALAKAKYRSGFDFYNDAIQLLNKAAEIAVSKKMISLQTEIYRFLGNIYSDWGEYIKAIYYYELAIKLEPDIYNLFRALSNVIRPYTETGRYETAWQYLIKMKNMFNNFPADIFERYLLRSWVTFCHLIGDFENCITLSRKNIDIELKSNIKQYLQYYYILISDSHAYLGKNDLALQYLDLLKENIPENDKHYYGFYLLNKAIIMLSMKAEPGIEKTLLDYLNESDKSNLQLSKSFVLFKLASYYLKTSMPDSAVLNLRESLKIASEKKYISFLENEVFVSREVFDFAIENKIEKQFVKTILENVRNKLSYSFLSDECRSRLTLFNEELTDIKMESFGKLEFCVRGIKVEEDKWKRKKSKIMLAYLLSKPDRILNKNIAVDIFFEDTTMDNADKIYHNTISNIRTVLKVQKKHKDSCDVSPEFLIYEDKNLSLSKDYFYRSDNVEFESLYARAMSSEISDVEKMEAYKKTIGLYKGEFMQGYYDKWIEEKRNDYSIMFQKLCEQIISLLKSKNNFSEVEFYSGKLLDVDKLNEDAYLNIIEANVKMGNINKAKDKFSAMLKTYEDELGEKPSKKTMDKVKMLLGSAG